MQVNGERAAVDPDGHDARWWPEGDVLVTGARTQLHRANLEGREFERVAGRSGVDTEVPRDSRADLQIEHHTPGSEEPECAVLGDLEVAGRTIEAHTGLRSRVFDVGVVKVSSQ